MKKSIIIIIALFFGIAIQGFSQAATAPTDFFVGKWEMTIFGTPNGDAKMPVEFLRKEGKLTGEIVNPEAPDGPKIPITNIEEEATKITIYFTIAGYDVSVPLEKVDEDNIKGKLMDMFDTTAKRLK